MTLAIITSILFPLIMAIVIFKILPKEDLYNKNTFFIITFILAFVIKIAIACLGDGFSTDMNLFKNWGNLCNSIPLNNVYYQDTVYLDYPPAFLYLLAFVDKIKRLFEFDYYNPIYTCLVKLPAIIADMLCGLFIYNCSKKRFGFKVANILSIIYILNPLVVIDSSIWGQIDSICAVFLLYSLNYLRKDKFIISGILYGIGFLFKPQMMIFVPIYFFFCLANKKYKGLLLGFASFAVSVFLLALPFSQNWDFSFLLECYYSTVSYYSHYTVNAYNLYAFLGKNWAELPFNQFQAFLLTWLAPFVSSVLVGVYLFKNKDKSAIFTATAFLMASVFMFTANMHERYLFPAIIMILVAYIYNKDRRYLYVFTIFSVASFLNVAYIYYLNNTYVYAKSPQIIFISALHLIAYFYFVYLIIFGKKFKVKEFKPMPKATALLENKEKHLVKKDFLICIIVTVFYAFFAFWNLGSTETANTSWLPNMNDSVVFEVDEEYNSIIYLCGISSTSSSVYRVGSNFQIEFSDDGITFENAIVLDSSYVYTWYEIDVENSAKYVKITALDSASVLNEIGFKNSDSETIVSAEIVSGDGELLIDEQDVVPLYCDSFNSMYFDEVYHARTAYELILGVEAYENTHPQLGKLIIAFFISIMGMNPFAWRFAGALFGVLMLPVFYFILKRLFGSSFLCACGTILFAFDFMHFTQTRIATIDTYAVFFILLMYAAMLVFMQKDLLSSSMKSLLIPLASSGLFMGLGISSKWTCAYGAVGLAVLFFGKLIATIKNAEDKKTASSLCINLCLWCLLFFVFIPFLIYFIAFLPLTTLPQNRTDIWGSFINYQVHMYDYHANLVAEHYFASPWYEWPFAIRNIWYYCTYNYQGTGLTSTISCLGNPVLWVSCLVALVYVLYKFIRKVQVTSSFIIVGFLSVYLPWVLVSRLTFVYHYFTAIPFIIIALMCVCNQAMNSKICGKLSIKKRNPLKIALVVFVLINFALFIAFFPAISGYPTTGEYIHSLEWFPDWYFSA